MSRNWKIRIEEALLAIEEINEFIKGMEFEDFSENKLVRRATERNIEIIGEALNHVPDDIKNKYNNVPWRSIVGMRNYIIHEYFDVAVDMEWEVASSKIKELKIDLENILNKES